jgi:gliding motility-associated-like protein
MKMKGLKYLVSMLLLIAALQAAGQTYVIDQVCVGSTRQYRVDGQSGSSYEWLLTDAFKLKIPIPNSSGTPFTETKGTTIYGNEISINWNKAGIFTLSVVQTSSLGCDTVEQGEVEVYELPTVIAGNPLIICSDAKVVLSTAFASNYSSLLWSTSGDGKFENPTLLHTVYSNGPTDIAKGSVNLTLVAEGMGNVPTCSPKSSILAVTLNVVPNMVINDPAEICLPATIDLSAASITAGSEADMHYDYFADSLAKIILVNYKSVDKSGTYYIRGTSNTSGCEVYKPVKVKFTKQIVPNFPPIAEVCLNSTNPPVLQPSDFQGIGGTWSPAVVQTNTPGIFPYKFTPDPVPGLCAKDTTIWIEVSNSITPSFNLPASLCQGDLPPILPAISGNGISGTWNPAVVNTSTIGPTTYTFTPAVGQCGVPTSKSITVTFPGSPPTFTFAPICVGSIPPALPTLSDDGISGSWNPSVISTAIVGSINYTFTPFSGQCRQPKVQAIQVIDKTNPLFDQVGPLCFNSTPVVLPNTSKDGIPGTWTPAVVNTNLSGTTTFSFNPAPGWCATSTTMNVEIYQEIKLTITANPILTFGGTTTVTVAATGGSGNYTTGTGTFVRSAGTWSFTVTDDKGCEGKGIIVIQNPQDMDVTIAVKPMQCAGSLAEVTVSVTGGTGPYTYDYTGGDPDHIHPNEFTFRIKATPIPYVFKVTDSNGLHGESIPVTISSPSGLLLSASMTQPLCFGSSDGTATVTAMNEIGTVSYLWNDPLKQTTAKATGLKTGNYTVTVTDDCGPKTINVMVTEPPEITLSALGSASQCPGADGLIQFTVTNIPDGIYNITHDSGQFNSVTFTGGKASVPASAGSYTNLKISFSGCFTASGKNATVNKALVQSISYFVVQPTCKLAFGSVVITNPKQGSGFDYSADNGIYQLNASLTGLAPGVHVIHIRKLSTLCVTDTVATINAQPTTPANPTAILLPAQCETIPIQVLNANIGIVTPPVGTSVIWYDKQTGGNVVAPILNKTGTVTYYAEATNGICTSPGRTPVTLTIISMPSAPVASADSVIVCSSTPQVTLDARKVITSASKNLIWYDSPVGGNVVASPTLNTVKTVTYYAVESNGICSSAPRTPVTLSIVPLPSKPVLAMAAPVKCRDTFGVIKILSPLGPQYRYSMDNGPYQSLVTFNGNSGPHFFRVRNAKTLCESDTAVIKVPAIPLIPKITNLNTEDCICFGDSGKLNFEFENVADGTYVIVYVGGQFTNVQVKNGKASILAPAGTYNVLAIEANGCTSNENWNKTINQPDRISVSAVITEIDLKSNTKGAIELTISGGTGKYKTIWSPNATIPFAGATTEDIFNLTNGSYVVSITDQNGCSYKDTLIIPTPNLPPVASNDEFYAGCSGVSGDIIYGDNGFGKDFDPDGDTLFVDFKLIEIPKHGTLTLDPDQSGKFTYVAFQGYTGIDQFQYVVFDIKKNTSNPARVVIHVVSDFDCDGIQDDLDPDADADGILNVDEGTSTADSDGDGHPNWLDIDADNDGIVDNYEGQSTAEYIGPTGLDTDHDGIDDAYDTDQSGTRLIPVDSDSAFPDADKIPDFLDVDSDNDWVPDYIEGHDANTDGKPDFTLSGKDVDADGQDDGFDTVNRYTSQLTNMTGSNAAMQDSDKDGLTDWRDENDDDDNYLTRFEDLNVDGDYSNDDTDSDGHPEYLDFGRDCDLFIPEAFSPNDDNIHDYFQIYCIDHFPNAKMYIFDQLGNKLYEKDHYGNLEIWGTAERALWNGTTTNRVASVNGGKVIQGTYYYVLQLGNGEVKKSFVFVSY